MAELQHRRLAAIMFTDIVGYVALTQRNEAHALELLHEHNRLLRASFCRHGGQEIKTGGDGFLVEFTSALDATQCAIEIQRTLHDRNASVPPERRIQVRIGLHVGDVVHRENDVFGDGVNIAARIRPLAEPGGICLSQQVVDQIQNKIEEPAARLGKSELKNVQAPVAVYRIMLPWERARLPYVDRLSFRLRQKRTRWSAAVVLALLVLAGAAWSIWVQSAAGPGEAKSIAVLPFHDASPDRKNQYLCDGIWEDLIIALGQVEGLHVLGAPLTSRFRGASEDPRQVGKQLNVRTVIQGDVQSEGKRLRIRATLMNAADGSVLQALTYDSGMKALLDLQEEICRKIVSTLKPELAGRRKTRFVKRHTGNLEAYLLYKKGRYFWNQRAAPAIAKGIEYFEKAKEKDPNYALAYAGLADSYTVLGYLFYLRPKEAFPTAKKYAKEALRLDSTLAEAHASLGYCSLYFDWDWEEAEREFKLAIELDPEYATARHWYSVYLAAMGHWNEDMKQIHEALVLDPDSLIINADLGAHLYEMRQYEPAIQQLTKTLEMNSRFPLAHTWLGLVYAQQRRYPEAIAEVKKVQAGLPGSPLPDIALANVYAKSGNRVNRVKAQEKLDQLLLLRESSSATYVPAMGIALIYTSLGEKDQAFHWIEEAFKERSSALVWLKVDPRWDPLRSDPRFGPVLKRMRFRT